MVETFYHGSGKPARFRTIFGVYTDPVLAHEHAAQLREMGRRPTTHTRQVSADGYTCEVVVILVDTPKEKGGV